MDLKSIILNSFLYIPMPIIWLFIIYFFVKSNPWKKFIFFFSFTFLLITSLPIVSANLNKFFYSDGYKISNHEKNLSYVLIPTAGIYHDGHKSWHPTAESITRTQYGKKLAEEFNIPIIISGGEGKNRSFSSDKDIIRNKAAYLISEYFSYDFYHVDTKSMNTFQMAKNLKNSTKNFDGSILLATNPLHHKRTILTLEKQNFDVLIPNDYIKNTADSYSIMPSVRGFNSFNKIIYEFLGLVWYYLTGKI